MTDRRRTDAALRTDESEDMTHRIGIGIVVEIGDALHQAHRIDRRDEILGHAALQELTIEQDVVVPSDDDHFRARIAAFRELIEFADQSAIPVSALSTMIRFGVGLST